MAAADFPNHNTVLDIPSYHNLKTQYLDRCTLVNEEEATITIMKPLDHNVENDKVFIDGMSDNMVVFSFTEKVYNEINQLHFWRCAQGIWMGASNCFSYSPGCCQPIAVARVKGSQQARGQDVSDFGGPQYPQLGITPFDPCGEQFQRGYRLQMYQLLQGFK